MVSNWIFCQRFRDFLQTEMSEFRMDSCYCGLSQNVGEVSGGFETNFSISRLDRYLRIGTTLYSRKRHWIKMEIQQKSIELA